jgi:hypothetical protein
MRLPRTAHISRPWRIHELTPDFRVEDVWALPTPGGPNDLPRLVSQVAESDFPEEGAPRPVRFLWDLRWKLGALLRLDREQDGVGSRVATLRDRLPADLRDAPTGPELAPFRPVYQLDDEFAAELANRTVHAVMHLGWVRDKTGAADQAGGYRGQMAVLVKPNGPLGSAYMAAIKPFRYAVVYPALMRWIERGWQESASLPRASRPN